MHHAPRIRMKCQAATRIFSLREQLPDCLFAGHLLPVLPSRRDFLARRTKPRNGLTQKITVRLSDCHWTALDCFLLWNTGPSSARLERSFCWPNFKLLNPMKTAHVFLWYLYKIAWFVLLLDNTRPNDKNLTFSPPQQLPGLSLWTNRLFPKLSTISA